MARTQLLPQLNFTEDISRGDDPVYAFGTRLRQRQFTQADFALNDLNRPSADRLTSPRASRAPGLAFDSFKTQRQIRSADLFMRSAPSSAKALRSADCASRRRGLSVGALCAAADRRCPA